MKSAYDLAMERLEKQSPSARLTEEQKRDIAEIESSNRAKIAEKELFLAGEIKKARAAGQAEEVEKLERQLSSEIRRLTENCESKKERVRSGKPGV